MKYFGAGLGEMHKELGTMIRKADRLEDARRLFSELHGALHLSEVSGGEENELDRLTGDLEDPEYAVMVTSKDETIAWALWHIARLEDLTMNLLVSGGEQVWNREWARRLGTAVADTGNAMSDDQIMELSKALRPAELLQYTDTGGRRRHSTGGLGLASGLLGKEGRGRAFAHAADTGPHAAFKRLL